MHTRTTSGVLRVRRMRRCMHAYIHKAYTIVKIKVIIVHRIAADTTVNDSSAYGISVCVVSIAKELDHGRGPV